MITLTVLQVLFLKSKVLCFAKLNKYKNQSRMLAFVVKFLRGFTRQHSQNSISLLLLGAKHIQLHVTNTWARIQEILSNFEPEQKIALLIKRNRVYPSDLNLAVTKSSQHRCYIKKLFLEISQNSQENTCVRASFLIKKIKLFFNKTGLRPATSIKK